MRGETVLIRAFGGRPFVARVWTIGRGVVFATNDETFEKLQAGDESIWPIGFPLSDVFIFEEALAENSTSIDWRRARKWQPLSS